jgi:phosphatidylinositol 4-kinase
LSLCVGIICGSEEPDQHSLNNRRSHESLDSGETEQSEGEGEECIELVETTSMDEDYRELQSDLCFYQTPSTSALTASSADAKKKDENCDETDNRQEHLDAISDKKIRYRELNMNKAAILKEKYHQTICVPIDYEDEEDSTTSSTLTEAINDTLEVVKESNSCNSSSNDVKELAPIVKDPKDPIIKSFFFKNAIFRTAQSIIENHEKNKIANKNKHEQLSSINDPSQLSLTLNAHQQQQQSQQQPQQPLQTTKKRDFLLKSRSSRNQQSVATAATPTLLTTSASAEITTSTTPVDKTMSKSSSTSSLNTMKIPGIACMVSKEIVQPQPNKTERGQSGLLRFFESPVFNIHFAMHYLFYSKEPGVLSFIGNKIFSFPHTEVDLYIPQLILMYMQIDELAEVLDPYLVYRCRTSADFSLKCSWLLEAYNFNNSDGMNSPTTLTQKFRHLSLMRELYPKRDKKNCHQMLSPLQSPTSPFKKTHHRSQSDATGMLEQFKKPFIPTLKLCLGDLASGRAFDNGCVCFESQRGAVNDLLGQKTVCSCGAPKLASEREFMKSLIDIGKTLTSLPTKIEKTSRLRVLLNLINKNLPARVWLPLNSGKIPHHVVRITEDKTAVLNSKDKTPYIIYVEVVEVADIYTSPVIPKMMPTLRHTKSDEHLDQLNDDATTNNNNNNNNNNAENGGSSCNDVNKTSSLAAVTKTNTMNQFGIPRINSNLDVFNDDDVWSPEDDYITNLYLKMSQHKRIDRDTVSQFSMESCDSTTRDMSELLNLCNVIK